MTLPSPLAARRDARAPLAPRNWPIASRLAIVVAIPAALGLALAGLRVADAAASARADGQVARVAALGQQVAGLALDLERERDATVTFIADGRPAADGPTLRRQYSITDGQAAAVRRLARRLGPGSAAPTRATAATALAGLAALPRLRAQTGQGQAAGLTVLSGYSAAIAGLFPVIDGIADPGGSPVLITSVRALGSLSRMADEASRQQAILGAALAAGHLVPAALTALAVARAQEGSDLASFRSSATPQESQALARTMASQPATQARALEQRAVAASGGTLPLDASASQQWRAGMSYTVDWLRQAQRQLAGWVTAYAGSRQRGAERSAVSTGGAALAALGLALLAALLLARSISAPLRRLEAAALELAGTGLPAAVGAAADGRPPVAVPAIDVAGADEVGKAARAVDRVHREAVRLAGEQARQRGSISAICASSFRRSYALLERLLQLIDSMEFGEEDPGRLASLFQLDHLVTQMRRNADRALVLAGHDTPRGQAEPVTLVDVLRAAASEIEQYDRVTLAAALEVSVAGSAATDTVHLLAELLENGTTFSPDPTLVTVSADILADGDLVVSVTDGGPGMPAGQLQWLNWQLAHPPLADGNLDHRLGLFAVGHLAARHGISVALRPAPGGGIIAEARVPAVLISLDVAGAGAAGDGRPGVPDVAAVGAPGAGVLGAGVLGAGVLGAGARPELAGAEPEATADPAGDTSPH